jgi:nucleoside-triphosphatase THEP1
MGLFEFILGMTLICTIGGIITTGMQTGKRRVGVRALKAENEEMRALIGDLHGEVGKLKDRVRVLERLATDGDRNLADEIERLRRPETSARL